MHTDPVVVWTELPSLTATVDAVEPASIWGQPRKDPEPILGAWPVSPSGEHHEAPLVLDTDRFASPDAHAKWMEAVSYPGPVKPSSISDGIWFQYFTVSSGSPPTCVVAGEPFQLDVGQDDSGGYVLHHRHWSLCGFGDTLEDAVQDLWAMARTVAPDYLQLDASELTDNAQGLRAFLQRVL